jgi:DNA modification methylase
MVRGAVVRVDILIGDTRDLLKDIADQSIHCCVTSPPYFGLRDYGHAGQIGLEQTPDAYVAELVAVFREVHRVLRDDGTLWLNLGDSYSSGGGMHDGRSDNQPDVGASRVWRDGSGRADGILDERGQRNRNGILSSGLAPKNLIGIPWRVAFALQADGWYLRQDIIWAKPNPMPESVTDRCTKAHEYIFMLSKSPRYYYDQAATKLEKFKIGKTTDAYKAYSIGKLPPAHIHARAKRYAVKLFLSHLHETMHEIEHGTTPPLPYALAHLGHAHKIEVPR